MVAVCGAHAAGCVAEVWPWNWKRPTRSMFLLSCLPDSNLQARRVGRAYGTRDEVQETYASLVQGAKVANRRVSLLTSHRPSNPDATR